MGIRRLRRIRVQLSYRQPMPVQEHREYGRHNAYAVCPRCRLSMEREYMRYCDHCGQRLSWDQYPLAALPPGSGKSSQ